MITTWSDKEAELIWNMQNSRRIPLQLQRNVRKKLVMIDAAVSINDLRVPPANHLEKLSGDREGQYSVRLNSAWRICFKRNDGNVEIVDVVDYH